MSNVTHVKAKTDVIEFYRVPARALFSYGKQYYLKIRSSKDEGVCLETGFITTFGRDWGVELLGEHDKLVLNQEL